MDEKPATELTDDELFEELRDQVNMSRGKGHDRKRTRELGSVPQDIKPSPTKT